MTREDLEAAAARHAPPPKAVIELGNEREGTGAFDAIDTQCLGAILEQLTDVGPPHARDGGLQVLAPA